LIGINTLRKCFGRVNEKLPEHLQVQKPTGHSGRKSFATNGMKATDGDSVAVALATHHREPRSLLGYIQPDLQTMAGAAVKIGQLIARDTDDLVDTEDDESKHRGGRGTKRSRSLRNQVSSSTSSRRFIVLSDDDNEDFYESS